SSSGMIRVLFICPSGRDHAMAIGNGTSPLLESRLMNCGYRVSCMVANPMAPRGGQNRAQRLHLCFGMNNKRNVIGTMNETQRQVQLARYYRNLRFLVVDDFENFRLSIRQMIRAFGVDRIEVAG